MSSSAAVATTKLPPDSVARVMELCRLRRERQAAEHQVWEQDSRLRMEHDQYMAELTCSLEEDEAAARASIVKAFARSYERILEMWTTASASHRHSGTQETKQRHDLEKRIRQATFRQFWSNHSSSTGFCTSEIDRGVQARRDAVTVLRRSYAHSAPKFASDPEDHWRRGIAVAPDLQHSAAVTGGCNPVSLPAYHEFAMRLRTRYALERQGA